MIMKWFIAIGAISAFLSVALGAFGAHALKGKLSSDMLDVYHTGVQYQMYHSLGLILVGLLVDRLASPGMATTGGWLMVAGIVLFSGSLYALSLSGIKVLGAITPLGGVAFLAAWLLVVISALRT